MSDLGRIAVELEADEQLSVRFNARAKVLFRFLLAVYATLVIIYAFAGTSLYFTFVNGALLLIAAGLLFATNDFIVYFLASHPAWMFSFTAYWYSAVNLKPVEDGLFDAAQSITIAFVYQAACIVAFVLSSLVLRGRSAKPRMSSLRTMLALQHYSPLLIVFGALIVAIDVIASNPTVSAFTQDIQVFLWLGVALHLMKNNGFRLDTIGILIVCVFVVLAIYGNNRTLIMSCALIVGLGYLYYSPRLFNMQTIVLGCFAINFMVVFSSISIDIRLSGGRESTTPMTVLYADKLFTAETLLALVNPFYTHPSAENLRNFAERRYGDDFWMPYFGTNDSLGARFVVLPMADVVCGQLGDVNQIRWDALRNLITASMPNFGQTKILTYNDQLTWDLGLRDEGVIGKPMLTNACELYSMAGFSGVFVVSTIEFFCIFLLVAALRRQLEFYVLYAVTLVVTIIYLTVTTSSLGLAASVVRGLPLTILLIWLTKHVVLLAFRDRARKISPRL